MAPVRMRRDGEEQAAARQTRAVEHGRAPAPPARGEAEGAPDDGLLGDFFYREDETAPGLAYLSAGASARPAVDPPEVKEEWLSFRLGDEEYAVAIEHVREILKAPAITEVPRAPEPVVGVIMVRGEVIAILDVRRRLGLPPAVAGRQARVIVCGAGDEVRGFLVDAVSDVVRLPISSVERRPTGIAGPSAEFISGIGREADRLVILLDASALLGDGTPRQAKDGP